MKRQGTGRKAAGTERNKGRQRRTIERREEEQVQKDNAIGRVVIYQLFIESYSGRILVLLNINNRYPIFFFKILIF